jgi:energy-converting hydrogenase A subunit M
MAKEAMLIDYNDKVDEIHIKVNRETTPKLFEARVKHIMNALHKNREEAEKFCEEREDWKLWLALLMDDGEVFAIEREILYSDECRKRSPYTGRAIRITYSFHA